MMRLSLSHLLNGFVLWSQVSANYNTTTCDALSASLPDKVFLPETVTYNASVTSYPFTQLRLHPNCIVRPQSSQDVSTAVGILRSSNTKFAVRGGGHNANAGFNNIEDGVTIDMRSLNAVSVDAGNEVVRVGGGAIWQEVYDVTDKRNISVLGGRIGVVGVAGFVTGGGVSFFGPERGWACDYVVNFEIVLASGLTINANATSGPDLFAALKGGQSNFGIITRFDLKAFPAGPLWGGRTTLAPETDLALVSAFTEFKQPENFDPYAAGWATFRYNGTSKLMTPTTVLWYTKPELRPGGLAGMTSITPEITTTEVTAPIAEFARNSSMSVKAATRNTIWATATFHISPTIVHSIYTTWKRLVPEVCDTYAYAKTFAELTFQALPPMPDPSRPNSFGFPTNSAPEKDLVFLQAVFYFEDAAATEGLNNALKEFVKIFDDIAVKEGKKSNFVYLNFAAWFQDPLRSFGTEQYNKLQRVARKYDPKGFFQKQLAGGFKVGTGERHRGEWHA